MKPLLPSLLLGISLTTASLTFAEESLNAAARKIAEDYQDAIVTVKVIIDVEVVVGGSANQAQEQKLEVPGTVILANGLTVVSNASIDVGKQIEQQIQRQVRGREVDIKTTFKEVHLLLPDGTEISSKVVLKDGDLDLAFVLPDAEEVEAEGVEFIPVTFPEETPEIQVLDSVIMLNRLGKDLDREVAVYITKVEALIKKPRAFIYTHNASLGTPAFLPDRAPLGLYVRRIVSGNASSAVVLPAKEVARLAKEAANAGPETAVEDDEKQAEESKEEADGDAETDPDAEADPDPDPDPDPDAETDPDAEADPDPDSET